MSERHDKENCGLIACELCNPGAFNTPSAPGEAPRECKVYFIGMDPVSLGGGGNTLHNSTNIEVETVQMIEKSAFEQKENERMQAVNKSEVLKTQLELIRRERD